MKQIVLKFYVLLIGLFCPTIHAQWKYANANNIVNDVIITYDVKYHQELTEKQKKSIYYKKEIVVIFNKNKLVEKSFSNRVDIQTSYHFDYNKQLAYSCLVSGKTKNAVVKKFKEPVKNVSIQDGKTKMLLEIPCQVYTANIKGKTEEILTTKKFGLKYVKQFKAEGFLLKYTSNDKRFGPYTVTAKSIFYKKLPQITYSLKGFKIRTPEEHKTYIESSKERYNKNKEKNIEFLGKKAPNYSFRSIRGRSFKSKNLLGKVVVLNFWFTTCPPCKKEIPELNELKEKFKDKEVEFIAVALDLEYKLDEFLRNTPFEYNIIEDGRWVANKFDITSYPTNIIIDKKGVYQFIKTGYKSDITKAMSYKIEQFLKE
ncbi:TlpA disulfide reductase family protein [Flavivirga abyssicola]|uniref:TlpA family protein disulfide reductase n=1 Tax=Flavivirga abyssicola TaxID=3063533 RepID=UPI0026DEF384|nr:TlpA disulfide reductase family protein [Flavivirga sp. MEBiC07777]WVK13753.1 TlpA disulfide reductase family protein [Flavivirga sp. MEBiC07777]